MSLALKGTEMPEPENSPAEGFVSTDGSLVDGWQGRLSDETLRDDSSLARFNNFNDLAKSFVSTKKMMGRDPDSLVEMPGEDATDEVRAEFHRRRGVPESAEGYKYERGKELSENIDIDDAKVQAFAQIARKHNLTPSQFNGVCNDYLSLVDKDIAAFDMVEAEKKQKEFETADKALKKEWGNAYEERAARANLILMKYRGQDFVAKSGLENSAELTEFLDRIADDMSEDRIKGLTSVSVPTPDQMDSKIAELRAHPAYLDRSHPQHKDLVAQVTELYKRRAG